MMRQFVADLFKKEIANFELIHDYFENKNIFWIDDSTNAGFC